MAVRTRTPSRPAGRRVSLTRPGTRNKGRNRPREQAARIAFSVRVPWDGLRQIFSIVGVISVFLCFFGILSVGFLYGYRYLTNSHYFSLKNIEIQGNSRLSSREILEIAGLRAGDNTLALSIDEVEAAVKSSPWVEEVSVKRVLPETLVIGLLERSPAFWVLHDGTLHYADAYGRPIAPVEPGGFSSLPALEVESGAEDATAALPDLVRSLREARLPLDMNSISWVRLSAARGVELYAENSRLKVSVSLEEWLANLERLELTMEDLARRGELPAVREIKALGANVWVERTPRVAAGG